MKKGFLARLWDYAGLIRDLQRLRKAGEESVRERAKQHLRERMGEMHGLAQKAGQLMTLSLDEDLERAYAPLTNRAEPLPAELMLAELAKAWDQAPGEVLDDFAEEGLAASLGQVHQARFEDGTLVAVKVAYPGIREAVTNDLRLLGWLDQPARRKLAGLDFGAYQAELQRDLEEELDYRKEAANQSEYAAKALPAGDVVVPAVHGEWTRANVLVMDWQESVSIEEARQWNRPRRLELAKLLVRHFLHMIFEHGLLHADPHPGNYGFRVGPDGKPRLVLYDYGSVIRISLQQRLALLQLIEGARDHRGQPLKALAAMGFNKELLLPIAEQLPALCDVLLEPFLVDRPYRLASWDRKRRVDDILGENRWNFRLSGPPPLMFLMRGFHGLIYYLDRLDVDVDWAQLYRPVAAKLATARALFRPPAVKESGADFAALARSLRVAVYRDGAQTVGVTFQARAVENLVDLMGEDLAERCAARGIDLEAILREARINGYRPGPLFKLEEDDGKSYRVWLE